LFLFFLLALPEKSKDLIGALSKELLRMGGPVESGELDRAKRQLKSAVYMQLESRPLQLEDVGRQIMTFGKVQSASELCQQIEAVTAADIQRVANNLVKTPLSMAAAGDLSYTPRYDIVQRNFK